MERTSKVDKWVVKYITQIAREQGVNLFADDTFYTWLMAVLAHNTNAVARNKEYARLLLVSELEKAANDFKS
jgi:hypothetical protein